MSKHVLSLIFISITLFGSLKAGGKGCGHSHMMKGFKPGYIPGKPMEGKVKSLQNQISGSSVTDSTHPMKIVADYSAIPEGPGKEVIVASMEKSVLPRIMGMFKVVGNGRIPSFPTSGCEQLLGSSIPTSYQTNETEADFLLFVGLENDPRFLGSAGACISNTEEKRPVIGVMLIGPSYHDMTTTSELQGFDDTMVHEIFHALGFSPDLFDIFPIDLNNYTRTITQTINGQTSQFTALTSPRLVEEARRYFNCPSLEYVPLEDEGGEGSQGSHWEENILFEEMMTPTGVTGNSPLSRFTVAFFNELGVYEVDMNKAQPFTAGQNAGCGFYNNNCSTQYNIFCNQSSPNTCTANFLTKGLCESTNFNNGCYMNFQFFNRQCDWAQSQELTKTSPMEGFGLNSRCFETVSSSINNLGCYRSRCDNGSVVVIVQNDNGSGESEHTCSAGETITIGQTLSIKCPSNTSAFCASLSPSCPNNCNGSGLCLNDGTCFCNIFTKGNDCSIVEACTFGQRVCSISTLPLSSGSSLKNALKLSIFVGYSVLSYVFM